MNDETELAAESDGQVKHSRLPLAALGVTTVLLLGVILSKNPTVGGPVTILFFLAVLFIWLLCLLWLALQLVVFRVTGKPFSLVRHLYTSVALATGVIFLVGLQTLRQLQLTDVVLVIVFEFLLNFYLLRRF